MTAPLEVYAPGDNGWLPDAGYWEQWEFVKTLDDPMGFMATQEKRPFMRNGGASNVVLPNDTYAMWADLTEKIRNSDAYAEQVRGLFDVTVVVNGRLKPIPASSPWAVSPAARASLNLLFKFIAGIDDPYELVA